LTTPQTTTQVPFANVAKTVDDQENEQMTKGPLYLLVAIWLFVPPIVNAKTVTISVDENSALRFEERADDYIYTINYGRGDFRFDLPHVNFLVAIPNYRGAVTITATTRGVVSHNTGVTVSTEQKSKSEIDYLTIFWELGIAYGEGDTNGLYLLVTKLADDSYAAKNVDTLLNIAKLHLLFRDLKSAEQAVEQVLHNKLAKKTDKLHALLIRSRTQLDRGKQGDRIQSLESTLKLLEAGDDPVEQKWKAIIWSEICDARIFLGESVEAKKCFIRAHQLAEQWPDVLARVWNNQGGYSAEILNNLDESLEQFDKSEKLYNDIGQSLGQARALYNRGYVLRKKGNYHEALASLFSALDHIKGAHNPSLEGNIIAAIGGVYVLLENYLHAQQFLENALSQLRAGVPDRTIYAMKSSLGDAKRNLDDAESALKMHKEYINHHEKVVKTKQKWRLGLAYLNMAADYIVLEKFDEAEESSARGLDLLKNEKEEYQGAAMLSAARVQFLQEKYSSALQSATLSRTLLEQGRHTLPKQVQAISLQLAASYKLQQWDNAEYFGEEAVGLARRLVENMPMSETRHYFRSTLNHVYANLADVYIQRYFTDRQEKHLRTAVNMLERSRIGDRRGLSISKTNNALEQELTVAHANGDDITAASQRVALDRRRFSSDTTTLSNSEQQEDAGPNDIQDDELIIDYVFSENSGYRLVISSNRIEVTETRKQQLIDEDIRELLDSIARRQFNYDLAQKLGHELIGPIDLNYHGITRLQIRPVGTINHLPVAALDLGASSNGRYRPLAADYAIVMRVGKITNNFKQDYRNANITVVTTENESVVPDLVPAGDKERVWVNELTPLPWADAEVKFLSKLFSDNRAKVLSGSLATLDNVVHNPRSDIMHFATHGYISPIDPDLVGLILMAKGLNKPAFIGWRSFSGLMYSPDFVYLNGCQTGRGQIINGEGVFGLVLAFMHSGTKDVLATKWNVSDRASFELTKVFYENLLQGISIPVALQTAQLHLFNQQRFRDPYFWASHAHYSTQ
jgi:CHAT domain-containing protein